MGTHPYELSEAQRAAGATRQNVVGRGVDEAWGKSKAIRLYTVLSICSLELHPALLVSSLLHCIFSRGALGVAPPTPEQLAELLLGITRSWMGPSWAG